MWPNSWQKTLLHKVSAATQQGGTTVVSYVLECKPPAQGAQPKKLELHCPRRAPVEAKFTLRDLPVLSGLRWM